LADWFQVGNPRIDEKDVQLSERRADFLGNFALFRGIRCVGLDDSDTVQFLASRIQSGFAMSCDCDTRTFF
jgi:hypothetical protein